MPAEPPPPPPNGPPPSIRLQQRQASVVGAFVGGDGLSFAQYSTPASSESRYDSNYDPSELSAASGAAFRTALECLSDTRSIDIRRIIARLEEPNLSVSQHHINTGDLKCATELAEIGLSRAMMAESLVKIKYTIYIKHTAFIDLCKKLDDLESSNKVLVEWLEDYENFVQPRLSESAVSIHKELTALTTEHMLANKTDEIREAHASALGELRHAISLAACSPSVCIGLQCFICMDKTCNRAIVPCGHLICGDCATRTGLYMRECFVCRAKVEHVMRFYHGAI